MATKTTPVPGTGRNRGQTVIDVLVGVGVFLIAVGFVFSFVPSMVDPFAGNQEVTLVADRIADEVANGMMADATKSSVLNETCTYTFFNDSYGDGDDCALSYNDTETDLPNRLGIDSTYSVNVSIQRNVSNGPSPDILCTDGTGVKQCTTGLDRLAIGPTPPSDGSVVATRRTRFIDGKDVLVAVKVW